MFGAAGAVGYAGDESARTFVAEHPHTVTVLARALIGEMTESLQALADVTPHASPTPLPSPWVRTSDLQAALHRPVKTVIQPAVNWKAN